MATASTSDSAAESSQQAPVTSAPAADTPGLDVDSQASSHDGDSAIGSMESSTQSVRDSVYEYVEENGRRFHKYKQGNYLLPNDETEQDRLDLQHHLFTLTFDGKLHIAPIEELKGGVHNVLDIGTGTGIWAIDFAATYPSANVIGTDLSPIQPNFVPPNCSFEVDDAEDEWVFPQKFDYIHGRALMSCFRNDQRVWEHAFKALRPGGILELQDLQMPLRYIDSSGEGTALKLWNERFMAAGLMLGRDFTKVAKYKATLEKVGFVDVVEKRYYWPVGTWAKGKKMKTLGAWYREDCLAGLQGASVLFFTRALKMTPEEVEVFLVDVRKGMKMNSIHAYAPVYVVYGRKPE
ncbi:S-adenosyl-L-methionine-dependent methyltransferase [Hyaloscypha variabilis]